MIRATVLTLCLILFPVNLAAQTAPQVAPQAADPGKAEVLALLGGVMQKLLPCQWLAQAALAKTDRLDSKKPAYADAIRAAFIPARDGCLAAQRDIQAIKPPASLAPDSKATADRLLQSCATSVGVTSQFLDTMMEIAIAGDKPNDELGGIFYVYMDKARDEGENCQTAMRDLVKQSGASDAEIKAMFTSFLAGGDADGVKKP